MEHKNHKLKEGRAGSDTTRFFIGADAEHDSPPSDCTLLSAHPAKPGQTKFKQEGSRSRPPARPAKAPLRGCLPRLCRSFVRRPFCASWGGVCVARGLRRIRYPRRRGHFPRDTAPVRASVGWRLASLARRGKKAARRRCRGLAAPGLLGVFGCVWWRSASVLAFRSACSAFLGAFPGSFPLCVRRWRLASRRVRG